jgi:hypothetical protein
MANPERPHVEANRIPNADRAAALADIDRRLEIADANENTVERFFRRDELLEERDALIAELEETPPAQE